MLLKVKVKSLSRVQLFATPWIVAYQASLSIGFSRQEYWSRLPFPSPGDLPDPGIKPRTPALQADVLPFEPPGKPNVKQLYSIFKKKSTNKIKGRRGSTRGREGSTNLIHFSSLLSIFFNGPDRVS